jgi:hypothetical protein
MFDPYNPDWSDVIGAPKLPDLPLSKGQQQAPATKPSKVEKAPLTNDDFPAIEHTHPLKLREFSAPENVDPQIWQDEREIPPSPSRQDPDYELGWQGQASLSPPGGGSLNSRATAAQPPAEIRAAIEAEAKKAGISPAYALAVAERESSFNPNSGGTGSIRGLYQMTGGLRRQYGAEGDAAAQSAGFARFTNDLRSEMAARMGRQPTDAETYMGHHFGGPRAARMLTSMDPNTPVSDVFTPNELAGNPHIVKAGTVGTLRDQTLADMTRRMGGYQTASAPSPEDQERQPRDWYDKMKPTPSIVPGGGLDNQMPTTPPSGPSRPRRTAGVGDFAAFGSQADDTSGTGDFAAFGQEGT